MPIILRLLIGLPAAAVAALVLFLAMSAMIALQEKPLAEKTPPPDITVSFDVPEAEPVPEDRTKPAEARTPPRPVTMRAAKSALPAAVPAVIPVFEPAVNRFEMSGDALSMDIIDRNAQPMVRVPPAYPMQALERDLEGYCLMRFDVDPGGQPMNIQAMECSNSLFARPSESTVAKWKYAPKVQDGVPVIRRGVTTRIEFSLAE